MISRIIFEFTKATLRMALSESSGSRVRIKAIRSQPIDASGDAAQALTSLLGNRSHYAAQIIVVLSREQVITRVVKFPTMQLTELVQMVELYAKAQLPYPREQAVFDFHVVNQQEGFSTVAIVACQREVLDRQLSLLRDANVPANFVTVSSWGVFGWYRKARRLNTAKKPAVVSLPDEPSLVISVDENRTDLVLIADNRILSSRSIGQGAQDWAAVSETDSLLALEAERSRAAIRKELPGLEVHSVVLTGLGELAQWRDQLSARLSVPVVAVDAKEVFSELAGSSLSICPVVVGGVACQPLNELLNLSPPELRAEAHHRKQVMELVLVGLLLFSVIALGSSLLAFRISRQRQLAAQIDQALAVVEPTAKQIQEKRRLAGLIASFLDDRRQLASVLSGIFQTIPSDITLEVFSFDKARREIIIRGNANSNKDVLDYVSQLEQLPAVGEASLRYSTVRKTPVGERTDFELSLHRKLSPKSESSGK